MTRAWQPLQGVAAEVLRRPPSAGPGRIGARSSGYRVGMQRARRRAAYFWIMGTCVVLVLLAWNLVRLWSVTAAIVMSVVAAFLPPIAAIVGNTGALDDVEAPRTAVRRPPQDHPENED